MVRGVLTFQFSRRNDFSIIKRTIFLLLESAWLARTAVLPLGFSGQQVTISGLKHIAQHVKKHAGVEWFLQVCVCVEQQLLFRGLGRTGHNNYLEARTDLP